MPFITTPEKYGRIEELLKGIEPFLRFKFGDAGMQLMPEIRTIKNYEKLEEILAAIETAASAEEVRRIWAG